MLDFGAEGIAPFQRKEQKKEVVACVVGYRLGKGVTALDGIHGF
jgi:hypothetical protein